MSDNLAHQNDTPTPGRPPPCGGYITITMTVDRGGNQEVGTHATAIFKPHVDSEAVTVEVLARAAAAWYANWCAINNLE